MARFYGIFMVDSHIRVRRFCFLTMHSKSLCRQFDLVSLMVEVQISRFVADLNNFQKRLLESSMNGPAMHFPAQGILALYRWTKMLLGMFAAFCPS